MNLVALEKITERLTRLAEEHRDLLLQNAELNHLLREAEAARAEDLARFAHEMKKPLAVIRGILSRKNSAKNFQKTTLEIDAEISRAAEILDGIITLARLETRPRENERIDFSEICALVFEQQRAQFPDHDFRKKIAPGVQIFATPERVLAIAENLLENAGRHTPKNSRVDFSLAQNSREIILRVRDDGVGFSAGEKEHVLEPFRGTGATAGSGLGLAVVARAVEKLGGALDINSEKNRGSEFVVRLPAN